MNAQQSEYCKDWINKNADFESNLGSSVEKVYDVTYKLESDELHHRNWLIVITVILPTIWSYYQLFDYFVFDALVDISYIFTIAPSYGLASVFIFLFVGVVCRLISVIILLVLGKEKNVLILPYILLGLIFPILSIIVLRLSKKRLFSNSYEGYSDINKRVFLYKHAARLYKINKWLDSMYYCNQALLIDIGNRSEYVNKKHEVDCVEELIVLKGLLYMKLGHYEIAIIPFSSAILNGSEFDRYEYYRLRGDALFETKDYNGARKDWQAAIDNTPPYLGGNEDLEEKLYQLSKLG